MSPMTQPVSRRTIAQGAAWAVPTVAFAASAPAFAASAFTAVCPTAASVMTLQSGSSVSVSSYVTGDGTYPGGTYAGINAGQWNVPASSTTAGQTTTGYYLNWGGTSLTCDRSNGTSALGAVHTQTWSGASAQGKLTLSSPVGCSPQAAGAGLAASLGVQYSAPYSADVCATKSGGAAMQIKCMSIPFSITYLTGTENNYTAASNVCGYWLNLCFREGCQANYMTSHSITSTPLVG